MLQHPNVQREWSDWSEDQKLHVAVAYSNPFRWKTRRNLMNNFRWHMQQTPNVALHVCELAYGDRPFEVTDAENPNDIQLRTSHELFHKENILNAAIRRFPADWKYGAYVDADFTFTRHDWALEAIHQLQMYDFVQLFSSYADLSGDTLGSGQRPIRVNNGFAYNYTQAGYQLPDGYGQGGWKTKGGKEGEISYSAGVSDGLRTLKPVGATGGAWAFRRSAFNTVGGLLDVCILGHGDWFMTFGLVGEAAPDVGLPSYTDGYRRTICEWQRRAAKLKKNIGYVDQFATHHWHGSKFRRFYSTRFDILVKNKFDPMADIHPDWQGIYQLTEDKPALRDAVRQYFIQRTEDDVTMIEKAGEKPLV